jgi:3-oxoadipate enol-lactonase
MSSACALHYQRSGSEGAPTVVLGSSLGTTLEMWEPQMGLLEPGRDVLRFDHRGHGGSPVPPGPYRIGDLGADVLALLDRLELERVSYCGLSLGGMVGMWLAINTPARIERLVLLCTSAHLPPASGWSERAEAVRAAGSTDPVADAVLGRWFTPAFARRHAEVVSRLRDMLTATPAEGYAACCGVIEALDLRAGLSEIQAPTLVIGAEQDQSTPPEHQRTIAGAVAGARLELLDPGAHLSNVERAEAVNSLIAEHLEIGAPR